MCHHFDRALRLGLPEVVNRIDAASVWRNGVRKQLRFHAFVMTDVVSEASFAVSVDWIYQPNEERCDFEISPRFRPTMVVLPKTETNHGSKVTKLLRPACRKDTMVCVPIS